MTTYERRPLVNCGPGLVGSLQCLPWLKGHSLEQVIVVGSSPEAVERVKFIVNGWTLIEALPSVDEDGIKHTGAQHLVMLNQLNGLDCESNGWPGVFSIMVCAKTWDQAAWKDLVNVKSDGYEGPGLKRISPQIKDEGQIQSAYFHLTFNDKQPALPPGSVEAFFVWVEL